MNNTCHIEGDRTLLRRVCLAPFCTNIFTVGEGGTRGREKKYCSGACRKAASRADVKLTPWTKRAELQETHNATFEKVRETMKKAQVLADNLDVLVDALEVNGGDVTVSFAHNEEERMHVHEVIVGKMREAARNGQSEIHIEDIPF